MLNLIGDTLVIVILIVVCVAYLRVLRGEYWKRLLQLETKLEGAGAHLDNFNNRITNVERVSNIDSNDYRIIPNSKITHVYGLSNNPDVPPESYTDIVPQPHDDYKYIWSRVEEEFNGNIGLHDPYLVCRAVLDGE